MGEGVAPAVGLIDPKFPHNVGAAVRAASCYGIGQVWFGGDRVRLESLDRAVLARCHRFVVIPTRHCVNLAAAVYTVLYDRHAKRVRAGLEERNVTSSGDFDEPDHMADAVGVTWGT